MTDWWQEQEKEQVWFGCITVENAGTFGIACTTVGVLALEFGCPESNEFQERLSEATKLPVRRDDSKLRAISEQMHEYYSGTRKEFDLPVDERLMTPFQRSVLAATAAVRAGQISTYGEIAKTIGKPGAARAVGGALGRNPIPVIVPCHRVLAANGKIGGYSGAGGTATKQELLKLEGAMLA